RRSSTATASGRSSSATAWRSGSHRASPRKTAVSRTSTSRTSSQRRRSYGGPVWRSESCSSSGARSGFWTCSTRTETACSLHKSFPEAELERLLGANVRFEERVESGGYGRANAHWRAELDDGRPVFVKHALTDEAEDWPPTERP